MGQIHNEIRKGTLADWAKRAFGVTRSEGGVERYGETLTPIANPWGLPEWAYLRAEKLGGGSVTSPLVAGEFAINGLVNPALSNMLVVLEAISMTGQTNALVKFCTEAVINATLTNTTAGFTRDRRWLDNNNFLTRALWKVGSDVGVVAGTNLENLQVAAGTTGFAVTSVPIVIPPGHGIIVYGTTVASALVTSFGWRERAAYPGELV